MEHEDKEEDPNLVMVHSPEEPPLLPHVPQSSKQEPSWTVRRRSSADVR